MATPRDQILETAARLFFRQGYLETGINQLIAESEVARRTFYHHFPSKEDLAAEYIERESERWFASLRGAVESRRTAAGIVRGIFELVEQIAKATNYRGCAILNMTAEFSQANSAMRLRLKRVKETQNALIVELLGAASVSSAIARQIDVLLEGAIASAAAQLDVQPIHSALRAALLLVESDAGQSSRSAKVT